MRIAQVAPLYESVPPARYGGTERVVSYLTEALVAEGHDVTLFASGDSRTEARLIAPCAFAARLDPTCQDPLARHMLLLEAVRREAHRFDLVHFHCGYLHFVPSRRLPSPTLTTLHGRLDLPDLVPLFAEFADLPLVSISNAQRIPLPSAGWAATVHHGLPRDLYRPVDRPRRDYLMVLGRIAPEKGVDRAIEIAARAAVPLVIAAKVDPVDQQYFESVIRPRLRQPGVEFVGEVTDAEKGELLAHAAALLFPIDWPEPFGLVMIEALAAGTPVIAFRQGSVPEVLTDGVTGWIVDDTESAVRAVARLGDLSPEACREAFQSRFTVERMVADYLEVYHRLIREPAALRPEPTPPPPVRPKRVA